MSQRFLVIIFILFTMFCCKSDPKGQKESENINQKSTSDPFYCKVDSLTLEYLSNKTYRIAKETCKTTIIDREFILNERALIGLRKGIHNVLEKEELNSPIPIKEVKWESFDQEYITVWYKQKDNIWCPFHSYKYSKSTKF